MGKHSALHCDDPANKKIANRTLATQELSYQYHTETQTLQPRRPTTKTRPLQWPPMWRRRCAVASAPVVRVKYSSSTRLKSLSCERDRKRNTTRKKKTPNAAVSSAYSRKYHTDTFDIVLPSGDAPGGGDTTTWRADFWTNEANACAVGGGERDGLKPARSECG